MRSHGEQQNSDEPSDYRELRFLSEVDANAEVTQRELSKRVGIALGLTNLLMRNLAQKGYIRVTQAGWRRWFYNLTPEGFSQKLRLTVSYINRFLDHYQDVRQILREELIPLALNQESRVAVYGTGEIAELVFLGLREIGIEEIEIFGPVDAEQGKFLGMRVHDVGTLRPDRFDFILVAYLTDWEENVKMLREQGVPKEKLVTFFADGKAMETV